MARSFPPDVIVLDTDALVHARVGRGVKKPQILQAKSYRLVADTFVPSVVTPELASDAGLAEAVRRMKVETGRWNKASLLLPDSWFRMNILEIPTLPDKSDEADAMIRWSLKRTMPLEGSALRLAYEVLSRGANGVRVLAVSAVEKTLAAIERVFEAGGIEIVLIEPVGLNIWNALAVREASTTGDRIFFYVRDQDFTTALFRGGAPLFIRSRNLNAQRSLQQEIKLSASYLRDALGTEAIESCYLCGNELGAGLVEEIAAEFSAPVRVVALRDFTEHTPEGVGAYEAELTACTGVFTG